MSQIEENNLKCREHYESPIKRSRHSVNPLICIDKISKKNPYFCCTSHVEEFEKDFVSEEEFIGISDDFEGISFLHSEGDNEIPEMRLKDEKNVQCNEGLPISLKQISSLPAICEGAKIITAKTVESVTLHDPLIILPRLQYEHNEENCFQCKHCAQFFITGQALGGHMSRKHPKLLEN